VIILEARDVEPDSPISRERRIDIWWAQKSRNAGFALALGYMLNTSPEWKNPKLLLRTVANKKEDVPEAQRHLEDFIRRGRVDADIDVSPKRDPELFNQIVSDSATAALVFIGLRPICENESDEEYMAYYSNLCGLLKGLSGAALVLAMEDLEFKDIFV
jgi:hypothetical protein